MAVKLVLTQWKSFHAVFRAIEGLTLVIISHGMLSWGTWNNRKNAREQTKESSFDTSFIYSFWLAESLRTSTWFPPLIFFIQRYQFISIVEGREDIWKFKVKQHIWPVFDILREDRVIKGRIWRKKGYSKVKGYFELHNMKTHCSGVKGFLLFHPSFRSGFFRDSRKKRKNKTLVCEITFNQFGKEKFNLANIFLKFSWNTHFLLRSY